MGLQSWAVMRAINGLLVVVVALAMRFVPMA